MRTLAMVQARMGSTRLPGKVLMDLGGETVLSRVVRRLRRAALVDEVVVATTDSPGDDVIVRECRRLDTRCFRGSESDVLDRYYRAAQAYAAGAVVRVTADCPLIDAELVDETVGVFQDRLADYASNLFPRTYPRGLDVEVFTMGALERNWREAREPYQREHVTPYFYEHPELFRLASLYGQTDYSQYRWTLDTAADLDLLRTIYARLDNRDDFGWREAIEVMEREPELAELNAHVVQKALQAS
jgi:spore coat polysaccharide biosynthesis protein SpsF